MFQNPNGVFQDKGVGWGARAREVAMFPLGIWGAALTGWQCEQGPGPGTLVHPRKI